MLHVVKYCTNDKMATFEVKKLHKKLKSVKRKRQRAIVTKEKGEFDLCGFLLRITCLKLFCLLILINRTKFADIDAGAFSTGDTIVLT